MTGLPAVADVTDLIWLQTGFIGDVVLTTAAISLAARSFPGRRQHAVTTPVGARVLAGCPDLVSRIVFDKDGQGAVGAFRAVAAGIAAALPAGANALIMKPHLSHRSSLLARYLGLPVVTFCEAGFSALGTVRVPRVSVLHEAARIGLLLEPLGVPRREVVAAPLRLAPLALDGDTPWQGMLRDHAGPVVGIAPGSVWATKRWLPEGFTAVARDLLGARQDVLVVCLGSDAERPLADELVRALGGPSARLINLAGTTSLDDLRRVVPRLALLLANDSSLVHYASAFGVPTVAVFGATVPAQGFAPLAPRSVVIGMDLECRPCSDHGPKVCPLGHFKCMRMVAAATVTKACLTAIS